MQIERFVTQFDTHAQPFTQAYQVGAVPGGECFLLLSPQAAVLVDGAEAGMEAITLTDDAGNGYTYFKLRDLGAALGFNVTWDAAASSIVIDTTQPYQA